MLKSSIRLGMLRALPKLGFILSLGSQGHSIRPPQSSPRRILLIRPDHLGDLLFTSPALRLFKKCFPESEVTMLVGPWSLEVAQHIPGVDHVIACPFTWFDRKPKGSPVQPYRLLIEESKRIRALGFDLAINMRFDFWWGALLAYLADIPVRLGYGVPECRPFLTQALPYESGRHEALQDLSLIEAISDCAEDNLSLEFRTTDDEERFADEWLASIDAPGHLMAIHPGAGAAVKLWPSERYVQVVDKLLNDYGATVILTGSKEERSLIEEISGKSRHPLKILIGASLGELAAVLKRCSLAIGSDSGVLHLGVAVGTPTLHLYGPVSADTFGPWGNEARHRVITSPYPCVPCNVLDYSPTELAAHRCMAAIKTESVLDEVTQMLKETKVAHRN